MTLEEFILALEAKGIALSPLQIEQFEKYYQILIHWNEKINLTAITAAPEVYLKHFYDSLLPLWLYPDLFVGDLSLCDVGAGAGFPSIPLRIIYPRLGVTIIDSLNKRINFLKLLSEELGLTNVQAIHMRAEDAGQNKAYRAQFDLVTARAVAELNVLSEFCLPLCKKGGYFLAYKGAKADEEVALALPAIKLLGGKFENIQAENLPGEESARALVLVRKALETPKKYPRAAGKPIKQPLV